MRQSRTPIGLNPVALGVGDSAIFLRAQQMGKSRLLGRAEAISMSSKVDLVPSNSMSSCAPCHNPNLTESMLVPMVNQFGLMQQQMFDQFQQAMAMMVQMFGTMHRDQMEVIRAELDRLHELTDEFHASEK